MVLPKVNYKGPTDSDKSPAIETGNTIRRMPTMIPPSKQSFARLAAQHEAKSEDSSLKDELSDSQKSRKTHATKA